MPEEGEPVSHAYTKDEALWYAVCQMRRAARTLEIAAIMARDDAYETIYAKGLDMCADECEKAMDPENLKRFRIETFPDSCPDCGHKNHAGVSCLDSDACGCGQ
jgi:hypothetical protein